MDYEIQGFVQTIEGLKPLLREIMQLLASLADKDGNVEVSGTEIAQKVGVDRRTVKRAIPELIRLGHLIQHSTAREKGRYTIFHLHNETTYDKPYRGDYVNTDILTAIDGLNFPALHRRVFKEWACHLNKMSHRNIVYPSFEKVQEKSGYSPESVKLATNWLVDNGFMIPETVPHRTNGATMPGYSIPVWNSARKAFMLNEKQKKAIEALRGIEQEKEQQKEMEVSDITEPGPVPQEPASKSQPARASQQEQKKRQQKELQETSDTTEPGPVQNATVVTKDGKKMTLPIRYEENTTYINPTLKIHGDGTPLPPFIPPTKPKEEKTQHLKMNPSAYYNAVIKLKDYNARLQQAQEMLDTDLSEEDRQNAQHNIIKFKTLIKGFQKLIDSREQDKKPDQTTNEQDKKPDQTTNEQNKKKEHWVRVNGVFQKLTHEELQNNPYIKKDQPVRLDQYRESKKQQDEQTPEDQTVKEDASNDQ